MTKFRGFDLDEIIEEADKKRNTFLTKDYY